MQFAERYFKDLEKNGDKYDDFGRPATQWVYDDDEIDMVADKADATYTKGVKEKDIYKDLDISTKNSFYMITNGDSSKAEESKEIGKDVSDKIGGNGVLTEVFYDKKSDDNRIVVIYTYIAEIDDVDENDDDERIVKIGDLEYVTEEFEEDDMVLYTIDVDAEDEDAIQSMVAAEKLTGELTKKSGDDYTIDGTKYTAAKEADIDAAVGVKDDVDFYLDSFGYILKMDEAEDNDSVENLAYVLGAGESRSTYWAKLLFSDGTTKVVDTTKNTETLKNDIVSFKVEDDGEYKLTDKKADVIAKEETASFEKGETRIVGKARAYADSKTVFVYAITDDDDVDYVTYTGFKSAPSFNGTATVTAYTKTDKKAATLVVVEIDKSDMHSTSADLTFLAAQDDLDTIDDGDGIVYYEFQAVVDSKLATVKIDADVFTKEFPLENGVIVLNKVSYDSDDLGDKGSAVAEGKDPYAEDADKKDYFTATTCKKESNETVDLGGYSLAYADGVKVFVVEDDEITEDSISSIREDNDKSKDPYSKVYYTLDDGDVDLIILVKN